MNLVYLFRRLVFTQVLVGIVAFCMAERNPGLLLVSGGLAALSWLVVEGPTGRPLPRFIINLASMSTVIWLLFDLFLQRGDIVLAMGHFTMWLQVVLLYAQKNNRDYGQLLVLSLLQMIGATMLSQSFVFGMLLVAYCVLALCSALLLHLKSTSDGVTEANQAAAPMGVRVNRPKSVTCRGHRMQFRLTALAVGLGCGGVGVLVFLGVPRSGQANSGLSLPHQREAGFSAQIDLNGSAPSTGRKDVVLVVKAWANGRELTQDDAGLLLRGASLDQYDTFYHTWTRGLNAVGRDLVLPLKGESEPGASGQRVLAPMPDSAGVLEAEITLRNISQQVLFTLHPLSWVQSSSIGEISFNPLDQQMMLTEPRTSAMSYRVQAPIEAPPGFFEAYRHLPTPAWRGVNVDDDVDQPRRRYALRWETQRDRVADLARSILKSAGLPRGSGQFDSDQSRVAAQALADHLRANFKYDLRNPVPAAGEEPTIEFLFRNRKGHCELFASGLAALARSAGLPARVITGYRVSEYNSIGGYFVVRPTNAHAWTEIYCGDFGWLAFDATPPDEVAAEHMPGEGYFQALRHLYEYVELLWVRSVVGFDQPSQEALVDDGRAWTDQQGSEIDAQIQARLEAIKTWYQQRRLDRLTIVIVCFIGFFILVGIVSLVRTITVRRRRLVALQLTRLPRAQRRTLAKQLRFYLTMLDMLERHGFVRPAWQSPFGFAKQLAEAHPQRFVPVVSLTELFYEIRFGHRILDAARRQTIKTRLAELEENLLQRTAKAAS